MLTFEIANPRIDSPPEVYLNGQNIGPASLTLPDLADPAYRGEVEPLSTQMHFNYTGWLRAQKIVPAASLKVGTNDLVVVNGAGRRSFGNPRHADSIKVYLGQVGLSVAHRALEILKEQGSVTARRREGYSFIEMRMKRKQQGFTLLEIMLVVSIIVIILGVAISKLGNTTAIAKTMRVQADVQAIKTQLQLYESMNGFYPTTEQGLQALVTQPDKDPRPARWYQLFKEMPKDPWGNDTFIEVLV